jgi:hypothetical protein
MSDSDLRALYRFIRHLGPAGSSAPGYVPPGQEPVTSYISFVPLSPGANAAGSTPTTQKSGQKPEEKDSSFWDFDFKPAAPRIDRP